MLAKKKKGAVEEEPEEEEEPKEVIDTEAPPAEQPKIMTLLASPPNARALSLTQRSANCWSCIPRWSGLSPVEKKPKMGGLVAYSSSSEDGSGSS